MRFGSMVLLLATPVLPAALGDPTPGLADGPGAVAAAPLTAGEGAALAAASRPGLEELRGAYAAQVSGLDGTERSILRAASLRDPDLEALRAGEVTLTDREVQLILITAGIVIIVALIL
ncbi:MAG TPA: hypothetical protein VFD43_03730 [Planctomycetota bacterium]|nr:hypothetical protein [Planctomycetota bacterium]